MFVDKSDTTNFNIPKMRGIKETIDIDLRLFNNSTFIDGMPIERNGLLLKEIKTKHSNFHSQDNKDVCICLF